jgi:hypothetical protein
MRLIKCYKASKKINSSTNVKDKPSRRGKQRH